MKTKQIKKSDIINERAFLTLMSSKETPWNERIPKELKTQTSIGRSPDNDLCLMDPFSSQYHCRVERSPAGYVLSDLSSRNGTLLNGNYVREARLKDHDRIQVGETVFLFSLKCETHSYRLGSLSKNKKWNMELERLPLMARSDLPVLILGPSGCGKELLANKIHQDSNRSMGPFVSVNCSAMSESLIESELFGHLKGSFTSAHEDRKGAFEAAKGGTLFLDEIGDLPVTAQPKLLRALENQEIKPVGSDHIVKTDVRVISATHKNLANMVQNSLFRNDLYYRLNILKITPPPLALRMEDFDDLLMHFCKQYKVKLSLDSTELLKRYRWPGNIRELKNLVMRLSATYPYTIIQRHQAAEALDLKNNDLDDYDPMTRSLDCKISKKHDLRFAEREMICRALMSTYGNRRKAAESIGMAKSTFHDKVKLYEINIEELLRS